MDKLKIGQYKTSFDRIAHYIENEQKEQVEIWFARELQAVLGYARWENFVVAINRAVQSCKTQSINVDDHFREVTKMITYIKLFSQQYSKYPKDEPVHIYKVFPFYHCSR